MFSIYVINERFSLKSANLPRLHCFLCQKDKSVSDQHKKKFRVHNTGIYIELAQLRYEKSKNFFRHMHAVKYSIWWPDCPRLPESIGRFIEGQAFFRSCDSAPRPPLGPSLPPPVSKVDRRHTGKPRKRNNLLTWEGAGVEPNHMTARKPGPL